MARVISRQTSYDYVQLKPTLFDMMDSLGGDRIGPGMRVLLKPNLLAPATPDRAILTHPGVVRAAAEYVLGKGALVQISDSPATGGFEKILKESGIGSALEGLNVTFKEFKVSSTVRIHEPYNTMEIAEDALKADMIVNLPKLKTHCQMVLTLGVKNLFGCVVGFRKPEWHMKTGVAREAFAGILVEIYNVLRPSITILDGILAMEGQGPGRSGTPREVGLLMGSDDAMALDAAVCDILGIAPDTLPTIKSAKEMGVADGPVDLEGVFPKVADFKIPGMKPVLFGPPMLHGLLRKYLTQRPVPLDMACRLCGECRQYCPAKAISSEGKKILFDYDKCIRCYCCVEICPHAALRVDQPAAGKLLADIIRRAFGISLD